MNLNKLKRRVRKRVEFYLKEFKENRKILPGIKRNQSRSSSNRLFHVSAFNYYNAGDTILPLALQDTWNEINSTIKWINQPVYPMVDAKMVKKINKSKGLVIGGGGLFLKDTNANKISGWQWPCSIEMLNEIEVPIFIYAVGYNRFRNQDDFEPCFIENIRALSEKACYLGLRNTGSIKAVRSYLPANLHSKIRFQPCMTTYLSELYKKEINFDGSKQNFIAVNAAFDRSYLRFGNKIGQVLSDLALVLKDLSKIIPIKFYSHMASDESLLPFLDSFKVNYEVIRLNGVNPKEIIEAYIKPKLVIGMRGHAQMIPFGCKTPILSIITHDKMQWFLDDIGRPEWGVEALDANFKHILKEKSLLALDDIENRIDFIERKQREFFEISIKNVHEAFTYMKVN